jgi:hypothetical protein
MSGSEPAETTNLDIYGDATLPWSRARDNLVAALPSAATTLFLGSVGQDGRPRSAGVGGVWLDERIYFTSGPGTRKSRNLEANPACTISARLADIDLVLEGEARRVTDEQKLKQVAALYRQGGWPAEADGDGFTAPFSAPSAGPPPWHLYSFTIQTAFGVATAEPHGATRWRF